MSDELNRMQILEMIERGELSAEEGARRLSGAEPSLDSSEDETDLPPAPEMDAPITTQQDMPGVERWKNWWQIPLYIGVGITLLGAMGMYASLQAGGMNIWFFLTFLILLLGVAITALAWAMRQGPWLHVRVRKQKNGEDSRVAVSIPLPLGLSSWALRTFGRFSSDLDETIVDEIIMALDREANDGQPFYIEVSEEDGEHVEVFFG